MQNKDQVNAIVISPSKNVRLRKASGFSLKEIKQAGKTVNELKDLNIQIDFLRKSAHEENIEVLKSLKLPKKQKKKRVPFVPKERRRTEYKPKKEKPIPKEEEVIVPKKAEAVVKPAPIRKEPKKEEKISTKKERLPLTELQGLGPATEKKFNQIGVDSVEELILEDPSELSLLVKGCSEERIKTWIEEGKELVKK